MWLVIMYLSNYLHKILNVFQPKGAGECIHSSYLRCVAQTMPEINVEIYVHWIMFNTQDNITIQKKTVLHKAIKNWT